MLRENAAKMRILGVSSLCRESTAFCKPRHKKRQNLLKKLS